jgi:hypothetical protein
MREISDAQRLVFEMMRLGSFNAFDGDQVADDLLAHSDLWIACWWGDHMMPLRSIASIPRDGMPYGDSVYLLTTQDKWEQLVELAKAWDYDEIYAVFQDSDDTLLIAGDEVYHTDPLKQELEECIGDTLEDLSDDLEIPALVLLQVWWD